MMNRNERMEKLNGAGINTSKYFTLDVSEGIPAGAKIHVIIDDNGQPVVVHANESKKDEIAEQIIADGYVRNTKLHRRFVMAQMMHMLNYVSWNGTDRGFNACLRNRYGYNYTLTMMLEEIRVLSKLEARDKESFDERSHFFNKKVVIAVLEDYMDKLKKYVDNLPDRNCKGVPYKRIKGQNIFNEDLNKKLYAPLRDKLNYVRFARDYTAVYNAMQRFMKDMIKLPYDTPKSKIWIDAYKGEGAYYTLKNLVMFHDCGIIVGEYRDKIYGTEAMTFLKNHLKMYQGKGWRMFALMKKVIEDNDFNFNERMAEIYSEQ